MPASEPSEGTSGIQARPCEFVPLRRADFEDSAPRTCRQKCLDWFLLYQMSLSGAMKSEKTAKQHVTNVNKFWTFCENDHISVFCSYYINRFVLNVVSSDLAPGTIRSYLSSLTLFVKAAFNHRFLAEPIDDRLRDCTTFIQSCIKYIGKLCRERHVEAGLCVHTAELIQCQKTDNCKNKNGSVVRMIFTVRMSKVCLAISSD